MTIARQFTGGFAGHGRERVPEARPEEPLRTDIPVVPPGLGGTLHGFPGAEAPGYCHSPLRGFNQSRRGLI